MVTVAEIAAQAFNGVSQAITDVIHVGTLTDGSTGRVAVDYGKPSGGMVKDASTDGSMTVYLEGFPTAPVVGKSVTFGGDEYLILEIEDIGAAGKFYAADVLKASDWLASSVTFKRKGRVSNGSGGFTEGWTDLSTHRAYVGAVSGDELTGGVRIEAHSMLKVYVEYFSGLKESDVAVVNGRECAVRWINNIDNAGAFLEIHIEQGAAN